MENLVNTLPAAIVAQPKPEQVQAKRAGAKGAATRKANREAAAARMKASVDARRRAAKLETMTTANGCSEAEATAAATLKAKIEAARPATAGRPLPATIEGLLAQREAMLASSKAKRRPAAA